MLAQLIVSPSLSATQDYLKQQLSQQQIPDQGPDILYLGQDGKFDLERIKQLTQFFSLKPFQEKQRVVVLENAENLNNIAQNALLKTIEELADHNQLWLLASQTTSLLPTLLSRCQITQLSSRQAEIVTDKVAAILQLPLEQQFSKIEKLTDKTQFLLALSQYYRQQLPAHPEYADFLAELLTAQSWFKQHVNQRATLEYLLLIAPKNTTV